VGRAGRVKACAWGCVVNTDVSHGVNVGKGVLLLRHNRRLECWAGQARRAEKKPQLREARLFAS